MADDKQQGTTPFGIAAIAIMVGLLGWAVWYGVTSWNALSGVKISPLGWVFMILGVLVTFLVGAGLMALVFYSSRHNLDQ